MEPRSLKFVGDSSGGKIIRGSPEMQVARICTDSREIRAGDLFVALRGGRFDGHSYVDEAVRRGAVVVLIERPEAVPLLQESGVIMVESTRRALGQIGRYYRRDFRLPMIVVGGSNGKTTTKELIASVLDQRFSTLKSADSYNNDVGVPLTLLALKATHQAAVLEVSTNHPGELRPLLQLIQPQYAVLTSIGREHLEFFGNLEGVVKEEGWLAESLPPEAKVLVGGDSEWSPTIAQRTRAAVVRVGFGPGNDWQAGSIHLDERGSVFELS